MCGSSAGLSLVRIRSDRANNPDIVHLVYSDGLNTVSVFQQRGQLTAAPKGSQWDAGWELTSVVAPRASRLGSQLRWSSPSSPMAVPSCSRRPSSRLPHDGATTPTTLDRIKAGWARILADVKG